MLSLQDDFAAVLFVILECQYTLKYFILLIHISLKLQYLIKLYYNIQANIGNIEANKKSLLQFLQLQIKF